MTTIPLKKLDNYAVIAILNKMTLRSFCRIQQTCHFIHELVIHNSRMLSVRLPRMVVRDWRQEKRSKDFTMLKIRNGYPLIMQLRGISINVLEVQHLPREVFQKEILEVVSTQRGYLTIEWNIKQLHGDDAGAGFMKPPLFIEKAKPHTIKGWLFYSWAMNWWKVEDMLKTMNLPIANHWDCFKGFLRVELKWKTAYEPIHVVLRTLLKEWTAGTDLGICSFFSIITQNIEFTPLRVSQMIQGIHVRLENQLLINIENKTQNVDVYRIYSEKGKEAAFIASQGTKEKIYFYFAFVPEFDRYLEFIGDKIA